MTADVLTAGPEVTADRVVFRVADPDHHLAGVRLAQEVKVPGDRLDFVFVPTGWQLSLPRPAGWSTGSGWAAADARRGGTEADPVPVTLTCGGLEENLANNRLMATILRAQGYPVELVEVPDVHNYTAWRDAFDPHLTALLTRVWDG